MRRSTSRARSTADLVVLADAVGSVSQGGRTVVGDVRDGRPAVADPEPHRAAALVGHVAGENDETLGVEAPLRQAPESPRPAQLGRFDGEEGRRHHAGQESLGVVGALVAREQERDVGVGPVAGGEERKPLHVVPVQVRQEHRAPERCIPEEVRQSAETRTGIEDECGSRRRVVMVCERDARGVSAEADVLGTRGRRRPPGPAEVDAHGISLALRPRGDGPSRAPRGRHD